MKLKMISFCAGMMLAGAVYLGASEPAKTTHSPEFERLKQLVGTWEGKVDMGEGLVDMTVQYRLIAAGSVLEERSFIGTPNEMVTMFYEEDGKVALTHYCVIGNRPGMVLKSTDAKGLRFDFDDNCAPTKGSSEPHMHALSLTFKDANTIEANCKSIMNGQVQEQKPTTLKRVKS